MFSNYKFLEDIILFNYGVFVLNSIFIHNLKKKNKLFTDRLEHMSKTFCDLPRSQTFLVIKMIPNFHIKNIQE